MTNKLKETIELEPDRYVIDNNNYDLEYWAWKPELNIDELFKVIDLNGEDGFPLYPTFKEREKEKLDALIVDIDGTIAYTDWKRDIYDFEKVKNDRPNTYLIELINWMSKKCDIIILSWRGEESRKVTEEWLLNSWIFYDHLYLREAWDKRCDVEVKSEIYEREIAPNYNVVGVFEDRDCVVNLWRNKYKLMTYQCWYSPD